MNESTKSALLIGYWYSHYDPKYPHPNTFVVDGYSNQKLVDYLKLGNECNGYRGSSGCRICRCSNGYFERTDGIYVWPDGLSHYVEHHNVKLPDAFLSHVESVNYTIVKDDSYTVRTIIDTDYSLWNKYIDTNRTVSALNNYIFGFGDRNVEWLLSFLRNKGFNVTANDIKTIISKGIYSL